MLALTDSQEACTKVQNYTRNVFWILLRSSYALTTPASLPPPSPPVPTAVRTEGQRMPPARDPRRPLPSNHLEDRQCVRGGRGAW